jgi:serine/threonine-protein kinase RsbW
MIETLTNRPATTGEPQVTLTIPCAAEFVGTVRLTVLGIASRMNLSIDAVEDVKMAVGEACTNAIERYRERGVLPDGPVPTLTIRAHTDARQLTLEIEDNVAAMPAGTPAPLETEVDTQSIGARLMEILVDEYSMEDRPGGKTVVRLTKYI